VVHDVRVVDPQLLILDLDSDPTWRVISYPDQDPARGSFRIRIFVCKIFMKFSNLKLNEHLKVIFVLKSNFFVEVVFLSLHLFFKKHDLQ